MTKECAQCRSSFQIKPYRAKTAVFCSRVCADNKKRTQGMPDYCREAQLAWMKQHTHGLYKQTGYSLTALHAWVKRRLLRPDACEHCGIIPKTMKTRQTGLHLANKSHNYLRDVDDWLWLCVPCHSKYDHAYRKVAL